MKLSFLGSLPPKRRWYFTELVYQLCVFFVELFLKVAYVLWYVVTLLLTWLQVDKLCCFSSCLTFLLFLAFVCLVWLWTLTLVIWFCIFCTLTSLRGSFSAIYHITLQKGKENNRKKKLPSLLATIQSMKHCAILTLKLCFG